MEITNIVEGKYATVKLERGGKIFISIAPIEMTVSTMFLIFPLRIIWSYRFPFNIRTVFDSSEQSKYVLKKTIESISNVGCVAELEECLKENTNQLLNTYFKKQITTEVNAELNKNTKKIKELINSQTALVIVGAYGDTIAKYSGYGIGGRPEHVLPYAKETIKEAILFLLHTDVAKDQLVFGYCELANYLNENDFNVVKPISLYYKKMSEVKEGEEEYFVKNNKQPIMSDKQKEIQDKMLNENKVLLAEIVRYMDENNIKS